MINTEPDNPTIQELTEQLSIAKKRLSELEERFSNAMSGSTDGFWDWDIKTNTVWYSPRFKEMLRYNDEDFPNLFSSFENALHPDDVAPVLNAIQVSLKDNIPYNITYRLKTKQLNYLWIHARGSVQLNSDGIPSSMAGSIQDITVQKQTIEELKISETLFRMSFENAPIGIALVAPNGTWLEVNEALCQMVGYSEEELLKTDFQTITHPDDLHADLDLVQSVLEDKIKTYQMIKRYFHKNGRTVWVQLNVSLVRNADLSPRYFISHIQDITKRKKDEMEKDILNEALVSRTQALSASNKELEDFAYAASHDLQEPLRTVSNYMSLLTRKYADQLDENANRYIANAVGATKRMSVLINDLLSYSRITTKGSTFTKVNINKIYQEAMANLESLIQSKNAGIECCELPEVYGDRTQLLQLLQNLINNAVKYCDKDIPKVHINVQLVDKYWQFSVKDNGIGIAKEYLQRIFKIFQRLHTRDEYEGTGVGLALCKKIVERHGGDIWVESVEYEGSTFCFTIPKKV